MHWNVDIVNILFLKTLYFIWRFINVSYKIIVRIEIKFDAIWCCGLTILCAYWEKTRMNW